MAKPTWDQATHLLNIGRECEADRDEVQKIIESGAFPDLLEAAGLGAIDRERLRRACGLGPKGTATIVTKNPVDPKITDLFASAKLEEWEVGIHEVPSVAQGRIIVELISNDEWPGELSVAKYIDFVRANGILLGHHHAVALYTRRHHLVDPWGAEPIYFPGTVWQKKHGGSERNYITYMQFSVGKREDEDQWFLGLHQVNQPIRTDGLHLTIPRLFVYPN